MQRKTTSKKGESEYLTYRHAEKSSVRKGKSKSSVYMQTESTMAYNEEV
jgi:hypothetical protein